jgi:DNA-binding NtrC family response regulator
MTGDGQLAEAVEALKLGAYDYITKPFRPDDLAHAVARALELTALRREVARLRSGREGEPPGGLLGVSPAMQELRRLIERLAAGPEATVLITGESGTGKDLAARAIHDLSGRARAPFVNITCTALPPDLLESELFGHERGAFTGANECRPGLFEVAHRGTVFLDEIGDLPAAVQAKLLRVLEAKRFRRLGGQQDIAVDVRILAATHRDLEALVREGAFREDLYYRLGVVPLRLPPLRERQEDIPILAQHFVERLKPAGIGPPRGFTPAALQALKDYPWPGNVRELRNVVERTLILSAGPLWDVHDLLLGRQPGRFPPPTDPALLPPDGLDLWDLEGRLIRQALERSGGNRSQAARLLGLSRDQIRYRIKKHGI